MQYVMSRVSSTCATQCRPGEHVLGHEAVISEQENLAWAKHRHTLTRTHHPREEERSNKTNTFINIKSILSTFHPPIHSSSNPIRSKSPERSKL